MTGLGMRERDALLAAIRRAALAMKAATPEGRFEMAMARLGRLLHERRLEQRYNPNWPSQPRVPRGNPDGGRWTDGGASGGEVLEPSEFEETVSGDEMPPNGPPKVPKERPRNPDHKNGIIRHAAKWARILKRGAGPVGAFLAYIAETWLSNDLNEIEAFLDEPKTLEKLQADVDRPRKGTQVHHIVEQTPARQDNLDEDDIESRRNKVRIPTLIHREITNWYNTRNDAHGGVKPRVYLRGKSFDERWNF